MEKTTPSDYPFHGERDGHKKASQCNNAAYSPPVQGGVRGGSWKSKNVGLVWLESKI